MISKDNYGEPLKKGKIYKITDNGYNTCYIGSTCECLCMRMARHRDKYKQYLRTGKKHTNIVLPFDEFGIENCKIELIETFPSDSKSMLRRQEGIHIRNNDCVNKKIEGRSHKEYREDNKERLSQVGKEWYAHNKEYCAERARLKRELFNEEVNEQGHGVANDHAAFDHGDQARLPKFLRFMNISLHC